MSRFRVPVALLALLLGVPAPVLVPGPAAAQRVSLRGSGAVGTIPLRRVPVPKGPPNVLVILTDDQRPDGAGFEGNASLRTPNLDRFAAEGARLRNFYVATPQCCPSRAALLTGRYGHQRGNGVTSNLANDPEHTAPGITFFGLPVSDLAAGTPTIATDLDRAGWVTGFVGKAHLGGDPRRWDFRDVPVWIPKLGAPHEGATLMVNGFPQVLPGLTNQILVDAAGDWMERHRSDRWFLWLATTAPHDPLRHDPRFPYAIEDIAPPPMWPEGLPLTADFDWAGYYSTISMLDDDLGRLFQRMRDLGLDRNTVVFYLSDNGQMAGSHGPEDDVSSKSVWFEESARVPGVVRWPGVVPAGTVVESPMVSVDVTATIRSLAGLPRDPGTEGMSMLPALLGRTPLRDAAHAEIWDALHDIWKWQLVREGDWKYVAFEGGQELLYDLANDPAEQEDLSARPEHAGTLARLRARLEAWKAATP